MSVDHRRLDVTMTGKMSDLLQRDSRLSQSTAECVAKRMERYLPTFLPNNVGVIQPSAVDCVDNCLASVLPVSAVR